MEMDMTGKKMLVVSAHPGDVLWRCSGAIAKHVKLGGTVDVVVLTMGTGGEAKYVITEGMVKVNGEVCIMRGKKIYPGDVVDFQGSVLEVTQE